MHLVQDVEKAEVKIEIPPPPPSPPPCPTNVYAFPSHINMTTMIRQNTRFPPTTRPPGKPDHHGITWSRANFGPL